MGKNKITMKPLKDLQLTDDFLFDEVMLDEEICREVLEIVLGKPISKITYSNKEQTMSAGSQYKGIRMDVFLKDEVNIHYTSRCKCGILIIFRNVPDTIKQSVI